MKPYPKLVCKFCAEFAGGKTNQAVLPWKHGECNVCNQRKPVIPPQFYNYPHFRGHK